ncbi:hypothetical protein AZG88_47790 [Rhodococcus sp. LB1]|nr:hypothetical protein AZG88_47790 [Rhodococcus sp. LB1]
MTVPVGEVPNRLRRAQTRVAGAVSGPPGFDHLPPLVQLGQHRGIGDRDPQRPVDRLRIGEINLTHTCCAAEDLAELVVGETVAAAPPERHHHIVDESVEMGIELAGVALRYLAGGPPSATSGSTSTGTGGHSDRS